MMKMGSEFMSASEIAALSAIGLGASVFLMAVCANLGLPFTARTIAECMLPYFGGIVTYLAVGHFMSRSDEETKETDSRTNEPNNDINENG